MSNDFEAKINLDHHQAYKTIDGKNIYKRLAPVPTLNIQVDHQNQVSSSNFVCRVLYNSKIGSLH